MKPKPLPPLSVLIATFRYVKRTGRLVNKFSRTSRKAGEFSDSCTSAGYRTVHVAGKNYLAHRVIWKMVTGKDPSEFLDHIKNDQKLNNKLSNLRDTSHPMNMCNRRAPRHNTSGAKGVHRRKDNGKFRAYVSVDRKRIWVGSYTSFEEACIAVKEKRDVLHGIYARD